MTIMRMLLVVMLLAVGGCQQAPETTRSGPEGDVPGSADPGSADPGDMPTYSVVLPPLEPRRVPPRLFEETIEPGPVILTMMPVHLENGRLLWVCATEITWDAFDVFLYALDVEAGASEPDAPDAVTRPSKPYISMDRGFGHDGYPAISMQHAGAAAFCAWLSERSGRTYRLPTEAEWRSVCASGGVELGRAEKHAWFAENADRTTHPVANKLPDGNGLYDMLGNAAEWCSGDDGEPVTVGGSYRSERDALGCAARELPTAAWNASDPQFPKSAWWYADAGWVGFRVVCESP
jgi:formylglycine-generating enzyme required for sulfatase activity